MGLVSSDLQNIVNQLGKAKNSINAKYDIMRNNNANAQEDITHLYIDELSPSIDKIECLNSYDASLDDSKVLEGTKFYSNGKEVIGTMPINQEIDVTLDINHVLQQIPLGYIPGTKDLVSLIIKDCCKGRKCDECPFLHSDFKCYLTDIINIIKNYKKENK